MSDPQYEKEKKRYKEKEPLSESKSWEDFVRLAISRQYLEGRSGNPKAEVRNGKKVLLRTGKRNSFLGLFDRSDDPRLTRAISKLDQRAREYAKEGSKAHESESQHSHRKTLEENAPSGHSKHGKTVSVESHHVYRRHKAGEQDEEPRRGALLSITAPPSTQMHSNSAHENDRRNGTATDYEYVYPPAPPIMVTTANLPSESRSQDHQQSPQRRDSLAPPQRHTETESHLSSAGTPYMSGGRPPPAPTPPLRSDRDSNRTDKTSERRESASRSGLGYSTRSSDRHSQRGGPDRQFVRDVYSEDRGPISGFHPKNRSRTESSRHSLADGESRAGRQERMSGVDLEPSLSSRYTYGDESQASEATLGLPNWGSIRMSKRGNSSGQARSEVSRESTHSSRSTYSDESWGSQATVGEPRRGSSRMSERGNSNGS